MSALLAISLGVVSSASAALKMRAPSRCSGILLPLMRRRGHFRHVRKLDRRAAASVVRVLDHHQRRLRKVIVVRRAELGRKFVEIEFAVVGVGDRGEHDASQRRRAAGLVEIGVRLRSDDRLGAARAMRQHRGQVAHRAARHEQRGLLAHHRRGHLLEPIDGRVFAVNVVTEFGARDRLAHLGRRQRHRVAAQIDQSDTRRARPTAPADRSVVKLPLDRIDLLDRVLGGVGKVQLLAVAGERASRTDVAVDQRQLGHGLGVEIDLANRMIVGVEHVQEGAVGAIAPGLLNCACGRGAVLVAFFAGAGEGAGLERVDDRSCGSCRCRYPKRRSNFLSAATPRGPAERPTCPAPPSVLPLGARLSGDRLHLEVGKRDAPDGAVAAVGHVQRGAVGRDLRRQVEVRGRALPSSVPAIFAVPATVVTTPLATVDLANVGVVGVAQIEILPADRHAVGTVEARRLAGAVVAALLEELAGHDSQRLRRRDRSPRSCCCGCSRRKPRGRRSRGRPENPAAVRSAPESRPASCAMRRCAHGEHRSVAAEASIDLKFAETLIYATSLRLLGHSRRFTNLAATYGKIAFTTSSIARLLSASSVSDQVTATVAARRGVIPCRISSPA